jgi:hypothetical protein
MHKGTLDNLVNALGGLFALNIIHKDSQLFLVNNGVIVASLGPKQNEYSVSFYIWEWIKASLVGLPHNIASDVWVKSQIFLHVFRRDKTISIDTTY